MKRYKRLFKESTQLKLVHASDKKLKIISPDSKRGGSYFFDTKDTYFPYEEFNNIISKEEVEKKIKNFPEERDIYRNIAFYYGDYLHVVNTKLNKILDLTTIDDNKINLLKNNIKEFSNLDDDEIEEIIRDFYDTPYEKLINNMAKKLKYDAIKIIDNTEGYDHRSYILYKPVKV